MRFKTIFLIFNIVIVVSFLFIFFMPLLLLGTDHFGGFAAHNWPSGVLFAAALAGFNAYFLRSWRLFELLEREDWDGLIGHLEREIYSRNRITGRSLRILINAYLVTSRVEKIVRLHGQVSERRPELVASLAIPLGVPYLLLNRPAEAERHFGRMLAEARVRERSWVAWNHAFSLLQLREVEAARCAFKALLSSQRDPVLYLLSLYMLDSISQGDEPEKEAIRSRADAFRRQHTARAWDRRVRRAKENMQVLILSRIIRDASDWVFGAPRGQTAH